MKWFRSMPRSTAHLQIIPALEAQPPDYIPYEKKYGTMVSYWDAGNSYHVFLPWMWDDADCTNGWRCSTSDTAVNSFHSALQKFSVLLRQRCRFGIVECRNEPVCSF